LSQFLKLPRRKPTPSYFQEENQPQVEPISEGITQEENQPQVEPISEGITQEENQPEVEPISLEITEENQPQVEPISEGITQEENQPEVEPTWKLRKLSQFLKELPKKKINQKLSQFLK
jgi:hypothetical protein